MCPHGGRRGSGARAPTEQEGRAGVTGTRWASTDRPPPALKGLRLLRCGRGVGARGRTEEARRPGPDPAFSPEPVGGRPPHRVRRRGGRAGLPWTADGSPTRALRVLLQNTVLGKALLCPHAALALLRRRSQPLTAELRPGPHTASAGGVDVPRVAGPWGVSGVQGPRSGQRGLPSRPCGGRLSCQVGSPTPSEGDPMWGVARSPLGSQLGGLP